MRTIRFRGKRVDNGEWVEGDLAKYLNGNPCIMPKSFFATRDFGEEEENGLPKLDDSMALGGFYSVIPETVGQFTGLLDKNGKEIYEGDICKHAEDHSNFRGLHGYINYDYGMFLWHISIWDNHKELWQVYNSIEVIGNIHDNKDLIK